MRTLRHLATILLLALLILGPSSRCFALMGISNVSKDEAKEMGMEVRVKSNGPNEAWVELEFKAAGKLKDFSHVSLEIRDGEKFLLGWTALKERRTDSGGVAVSFLANRAYLDKVTLRVAVNVGTPVPGQGVEKGGYDLHLKDFVERAAADGKAANKADGSAKKSDAEVLTFQTAEEIRAMKEISVTLEGKYPCVVIFEDDYGKKISLGSPANTNEMRGFFRELEVGQSYWLPHAFTDYEQRMERKKQTKSEPVYATVAQFMAMPACSATVDVEAACEARFTTADGKGFWIGGAGGAKEFDGFLDSFWPGRAYELPGAFLEYEKHPDYISVARITEMAPRTGKVTDIGPCYAVFETADGKAFSIGNPSSGAEVTHFLLTLKKGAGYKLPDAFLAYHAAPRYVTAKEVTAMPRCTAKLLTGSIYSEFCYFTTADGKTLILGKPGAGRQGADVLKFLDALEEGKSYELPEAFLNYQKQKQ